MKWTPKNLAIAAGVVFVGGWYLKQKAGYAVEAVGQAVNPTSDQNLAYKGVICVGEALTGDQNFRLGSWWYDVVNDDPEEQTYKPPIERPDRQGL
jgi:hypothetical protein